MIGPARTYKQLAAFIILNKAILAVLVALSLSVVFNENSVEPNFFHRMVNLPWPCTEPPSNMSRLVWADAAAYLSIARDGYRPESPLCAFYPLFPGLLSPVGKLFGERATFAWGLLLSNLLSITSFILLYDLIDRKWGASAGFWTIALLAATPGAIYFSLIYTESLFLFLSVLLFRFLNQRSYLLLVIPCFLLPLTKAVGIFCLVPVVLHLWMCGKWKSLWWILLPPLAGWGAYFLIMHGYTGDYFAGFKAQEVYANSPSVQKIFNLPEFARAWTKWDEFIHPTSGILDRILFLGFLYTLPGLYRLDREMFGYALFIGLVPAMSNSFLSYTRFFAACFPIFVAWAYWAGRVVYGKYVLWGVVVTGMGLQLYCLYRYLAGDWVA